MMIIGVLVGMCGVLLYDRFKTVEHAINEPTEEEERKRVEQVEHIEGLMNYDATKAVKHG